MIDLAALDTSRRIVVTGILLAFVATWVAGEALLMRRYRTADGDDSLSVEDMKIRFSEGASSLFEARVRGDMRSYLDGEELGALVAWTRMGAERPQYDSDVAPILEDRCIKCHRAGGEASFRPLDSYDRVRDTVLEAAAPTVARQLLVTKVHLGGLGALLGGTAWLFTGSRAPQNVRSGLAALAFTGLFLDFGSWWLMRVDLGFAWGRVAGNVAMTSAFATMTLWILRDLWLGSRS